MRRLTFATPKNHFVFKRIFGSEQHKDVLVAFLNDMLGLDEVHRIVRVELLSPEQRPAIAELKLSIVDVKCTDARGVIYVVEMQVLQVEGFEKRVVYNVAKAYVNQIAQGDGYPNLNDVVGITICDFVLWPDTEARRLPMLTRWRMTEQQTGAKELGQIQLVFLELPKYDASRPPHTVVEKWAFDIPAGNTFPPRIAASSSPARPGSTTSWSSRCARRQVGPAARVPRRCAGADESPGSRVDGESVYRKLERIVPVDHHPELDSSVADHDVLHMRAFANAVAVYRQKDGSIEA
jgi:hypothetical protein